MDHDVNDRFLRLWSSSGQALVKRGIFRQGFIMKIWIRRFVYIAVLFYAAILAAVFFAQRQFLYFPPNFYHAPPAGWTEVKTPSGILGWHSPAQNGKPTVMVFHGTGSSIDSNLHIFRDLQAEGYGVWSAGYPGYPGNAGKPAQRPIVAAAKDQYEILTDLGVTEIVFYGTSLGSGVAAQLAQDFEPSLLIMDAPFNSMADMAQRNMPFLPSRVLLKDKWQSGLALKDLTAPMIWIHGTADRIVPLSQGRTLFDGYEGPKSSHIIAGAHHTNTWQKGGREIVLEALKVL